MGILGPPSSTRSGRFSFGAHTYGLVPITRDTILGAVSLIFWALLLLITIKYVGFVLYADDHGEGGVFALLGLLNGMKYLGAGLVSGMLLLGAGLLYGDGLITPAISILSAVEGLEYMTEQFQPYVIWIAAGIVLALFAVQRTGTARVGVLVRLVHGAVACQYRPVWGGPGLAASADSPSRQPHVRPHLSDQPGLGSQSGGPRVRHAGGHGRGSHVCGHGALWPSADPGGLAGARLPVPPAQLRWARRLSARAPRGRKRAAQTSCMSSMRPSMPWCPGRDRSS